MTQTPPAWDKNPMRAQRRKKTQVKKQDKKAGQNVLTRLQNAQKKRIETDGSYPET